MAERSKSGAAINEGGTPTDVVGVGVAKGVLWGVAGVTVRLEGAGLSMASAGPAIEKPGHYHCSYTLFIGWSQELYSFHNSTLRFCAQLCPTCCSLTDLHAAHAQISMLLYRHLKLCVNFLSVPHHLLQI